MSRWVTFAFDRILSIAAARNTFAMPTSGTPTAAQGAIDISSWRDPNNFNRVPDEAAVLLSGSGASTADQVLAVYGCSTKLDKAFLLASLNNAAVIPIGGAKTGLAWPLQDFSDWDFLAFGGLPANPTVTFSAAATVLIQVVPILSNVKAS